MKRLRHDSINVERLLSDWKRWSRKAANELKGNNGRKNVRKYMLQSLTFPDTHNDIASDLENRFMIPTKPNANMTAKRKMMIDLDK